MNVKINKDIIKALNPCKEGYDWYLKNGSTDLLDTLLRVNIVRPDWARWLFIRLMTVKQRRKIAIFAAEQALSIFEKKYPNDKRPRDAIEAAKTVLKRNTARNRKKAVAASAAAYAAAAAAAVSYAAYAADAAAAAADVGYAAYAADAVAYLVADAVAYAAADAATYAAADAARKEIQEKIIYKAVRILNSGK